MLLEQGDGTVWSAARGAVRRGWPITPGTYLEPSAGGSWTGFRGAAGLAPVAATWWQDPVRSPSDVDTWWSQAPYGVLLVCGHGIDALSVPAEVFAPLAAANLGSNLLGPVVAVSASRRIILTRRAPPRAHELPLPPGCRWLTGASWLPLPPTWLRPFLMATWKHMPDRRGVLPEAGAVQRAILTT